MYGMEHIFSKSLLFICYYLSLLLLFAFRTHQMCLIVIFLCPYLYLVHKSLLEMSAVFSICIIFKSIFLFLDLHLLILIE